MAASGRIEELRKRYDENPRRFFAPLANEYRKAGDFLQAIDLCRMHLAEAPANLNGQIVFGQALYDAATLDEARTAFETAISLDPENLIALRHLGDIARELGDIPTARQWYRRILDLDRRNEDVLAIMDELAAVEAAGGTTRTAAPSPVVETIELEEPQMHAPAPARPSIHSLIGAPPPAITQETIAVPEPEPEPVIEPIQIEPTHVEEIQIEAPAAIEIEPTHAEPPHLEPIHLESLEIEPTHVETPQLEMPRIEEISLEPPPVQEIHLEDAPAMVDRVMEADALDFGMVSPVEHVADEAPAAAPDSSFGFDVDLGAAGDLPIATAPDEVPNGNIELSEPIELREPVDLDSLGLIGDEPAMPAVEPPSAPPRLELVRSNDIEDHIDFGDHELPPSITPAHPIALVPDELTHVPDESVSLDHETPLSIDHVVPLELHHDDSLEQEDEPLKLHDDSAGDVLDTSIQLDAPLAMNDPLPEPEPVVETRPRSTTPVVFNFDLSVDEQSPKSPTPLDVPVQPVVEEEHEEIAVEQPIAAALVVDEQRVEEEPAEETVEEPAEAFATETMAELYVKQGLRHEAIGVYKQLVDARPNDDGLRKRLAELQNDGHVTAGSTARDFFSGLSRRTSKGRTPQSTPGLPTAAPPRGTLDRLFGEASVASSDESAAQSIAAAFAAQAPVTEESALDRVFKRPPAQ